MGMRVELKIIKEMTQKEPILGVQMYEITISLIQEAGPIALPIQLAIMKRSFRAAEAQVQANVRNWWNTVQDAATAGVMMKQGEKAIRKEVSAGLVLGHTVAAIQEIDQHHLVKERKSVAEQAQNHRGIN